MPLPEWTSCPACGHKIRLDDEDCWDAEQKVIDAIRENLDQYYGSAESLGDINPDELRNWARNHCPCMKTCHKCGKLARFSARECAKLFVAIVEADAASICNRPLCRDCKPFMQKVSDFRYGLLYESPRARLDEDVSVRVLLVLGLLVIVLVAAMVIALRWAD